MCFTKCRIEEREFVYVASIWSGIHALKKGHIWLVGDGRSINIWEDEWIPISSSRKVFTNKGRSLLTRAELINLATNQWDEELIDQTFCRVYACMWDQG
jgi:hypothetical protein